MGGDGLVEFRAEISGLTESQPVFCLAIPRVFFLMFAQFPRRPAAVADRVPANCPALTKAPKIRRITPSVSTSRRDPAATARPARKPRIWVQAGGISSK